MGISITTVWEIRPGAGASTNGGGFVPGASGTDYSQQNAAQYALTGVTSSGVGATVLTASAAADMIGNIAQVISGTNFSAGFYQVLSVIAGVSITFDRNVTSGVGATGVINIGGAMDTIANAFAGAVASNNFWIKATGTLTVTTALNPSSITNNVISRFEGYTTTRGDGGRVTWTTSTNSVNLMTFGANCANFWFLNFVMSSTAGTPGDCISNSNATVGTVAFTNCLIQGWHYGMNGNWAIIGQFLTATFDNCEIKNNVIGVINSGGTTMYGCYVHGNTSHGFEITSGSFNQGNGSVYLERSVFYNNGGSGVFFDAGNAQMNHIINCCCVANTVDGIAYGTGSPGMMLVVINNIITQNGGYGINASGGSNFGPYIIHSNAFYSNTNGPTSASFLSSPTDVTLTGDPFNNVSGGDFTLNNTSGAGASCKAVGYNPLP